MSNSLATRFTNAPVLVSADGADWFGECLTGAASEWEKVRTHGAPELMDDFWPKEGSYYSSFRPYRVERGTLLIPVKGTLLHDYGWQMRQWATGYAYIRRAVERGMEDPAVERIAFLINSGGGEVAGNFDAVDAIYAYRGVKPMHAFVDEGAYSGAMSIASVADKIIMPRTGGVGSVGVVTAHADYSQMLEQRGVRFQFIFAGKHKVDGNPYEALPDEVKNRMQARIDGLYDIFVKTVARNLSLDEQAVRDTGALTYSAEEAIEVGFAHEIRPVDEALAAFSGGLTVTVGDITMSEQEQQTPPANAQADLDAARAEGRREGAAAERERIQGILGSDEAKNRRELSFHLSLNTDISVEAAKGILAASAEKPEQPGTSTPGADFAAAMANGNPEIEGESVEQAGALSDADQLIRDYQTATGSIQ